jgi:DNA-binding CsgD family transcriptional regulator
MGRNISNASDLTLDLFTKLLSCQHYADLNSEVLEPVSQYIGASSGVFYQFLMPGYTDRRVGRRSYVGHSPKTADAYVDANFYAIDPCIKSIQTIRTTSTATSIAKLLLLSAVPGWQNSEYDVDFLKPYNVGDVLALAVPVKSAFENSMMCFGFHRVRDEPNFGENEVQLLQRLAPALSVILTNLANSDSLAVSHSMLDALESGSQGTGLVVLDSDMVLRHANPQGLRQLGLSAYNQDNAYASQSDIFGSVRQRLLEIDCSGKMRCGTAFTVDGIAVEAREVSGPDDAINYVLITREAADKSRIESACHDQGLPSREIEVAKLICAGRSNAEIADNLSIALRTVENHLLSIYEKAEVSSRTQLVSVLMSLQ